MNADLLAGLAALSREGARVFVLDTPDDVDALPPFPVIPPLPSATAFRSALRDAAAAARADETPPEFHESGMTPADEAALPPLDDYADFASLPF